MEPKFKEGDIIRFNSCLYKVRLVYNLHYNLCELSPDSMPFWRTREFVESGFAIVEPEPQAKETSNESNTTCPHCGSSAYLGLFRVECPKCG